jgi:hypothetical protein
MNGPFLHLARTAIFRRRNNSFGYVGISGRIEIASKTDAHDPKTSFEGWLNYQAVVVGPDRLAAKSVRRALWLTLT